MESKADESVSPATYGRTVAVALIASLAMMLPLQSAIGADSRAWRAVLIAAAMMFGYFVCQLLAPIGLGSGAAVGAVLAPITAVAACLGWMWTSIAGDLNWQPNAGIVVGLAAAVFSAALTAPVSAGAKMISVSGTVGLLVTGFVIAFGLAGWAHALVVQARVNAADIARLEMSALNPVLPDLEGQTPDDFSISTDETGRVTSATITYRDDSSDASTQIRLVSEAEKRSIDLGLDADTGGQGDSELNIVSDLDDDNYDVKPTTWSHLVRLGSNPLEAISR